MMFRGTVAFVEEESWKGNVSEGMVVDTCDPVGPQVLSTDIIPRGVKY
jgi:hypothetical protein